MGDQTSYPGFGVLRGSPSTLATGRWFVGAIGVWLVTRLVALVMLANSGGSIRVDLMMYEGWAQIIASGSAPTGDPAWQYPPALMLPILLAELISSDYQGAFLLITLLGDLLLLLMLMAYLRSKGGSTLGVWLWATAGLWIGPILLTRLDVFTALPAVLALALLGRPAVSSGLMAFGALMKIWPGLLLLSFPRRKLSAALTAFVITGLALGLVSLLVIQNPWSFAENQQARGLNGESLAAVPYILVNAFGTGVQFEYRFGSNEVGGYNAYLIATFVSVFGILLLATLLLIRLCGGFEKTLPGDVACVVILSSILVSRVFSPQYFIWLGAIGSFALLTQRTRMKIPVLLMVFSALLTQPLYPWFPGAIYSGELWAVAIHVLRMTLLLGALIYGLYVTIDVREVACQLRKPLSLRKEKGHGSQDGDTHGNVDSPN